MCVGTATQSNPWCDSSRHHVCQDALCGERVVFDINDANDLGADCDQSQSIGAVENKLRNLNTVMYSAGIDNSIRAWDIVSMHCRGLFENQHEAANSEISTLVHVPTTRALITGHHDGTMFWWTSTTAKMCRTARPTPHGVAEAAL